ncbi:hypothetical protein BZG36_02278 [Bifiguratus adelaidae]|uniref:intramembrane prenyl-peptidase Rce1 n=1 Tax=Bifiguratus adelaidae TaxID=1938954 RepID=A0A261XY94_9FUNG|nr:hypothetical protein BZG36_02278 [Bifiguratus adelaidae]
MKLWVAGIFLPVLHVALLFLGPLVLGGFMKSLPGQDRFDFHRDVVAVLSSLIGIRNYIMAPITEEWIFRGCMILLLHLAGFSKTYIIFVAPLYFGLAHIHHTWELFHAGGGNLSAFKRAILITGFQFLYTTVFGWYASFLFMRTGNIMSVIAVHAFCNVMGFPDLGDINLLFPLAKKMTYIAMISGLAIFAKTMYPLTDPSLYGRSLYWT